MHIILGRQVVRTRSNQPEDIVLMHHQILITNIPRHAQHQVRGIEILTLQQSERALYLEGIPLHFERSTAMYTFLQKSKTRRSIRCVTLNPKVNNLHVCIAQILKSLTYGFSYAN